MRHPQLRGRSGKRNYIEAPFERLLINMPSRASTRTKNSYSHFTIISLPLTRTDKWSTKLRRRISRLASSTTRYFLLDYMFIHRLSGIDGSYACAKPSSPNSRGSIHRMRRFLVCLCFCQTFGLPALAQDEQGMWVGTALTSRVLLNGFDARLGVRDLVREGTDARFDVTYYPLAIMHRPGGSGPSPPLNFEFGANVLISTLEPPLDAFRYQGVLYAGAGPRLLTLFQVPSFAAGVGGLVGMEVRYANAGLFLELDVSAPFLLWQGTRLSLAPVPIPKLSLGANYYF